MTTSLQIQRFQLWKRFTELYLKTSKISQLYSIILFFIYIHYIHYVHHNFQYNLCETLFSLLNFYFILFYFFVLSFLVILMNIYSVVNVVNTKNTAMHKYSRNAFTGICSLISTTHSLKPSLCDDKKHGSWKCNAEPTPLIHHVYFSNSPCSPYWPDNPCRQPQTNHIDKKGNSIWGSSQCVSGYNTAVNQMEILLYASQRAFRLVLLPKGHMDMYYFWALQPTSQITCATHLYLYCCLTCGDYRQLEKSILRPVFQMRIVSISPKYL